MPELQEVFDRVKGKKQERRKLKSIYADALSTSKPYQDILEQLNDLKAKKQAMEAEIQTQFESEMQEMDRIKADIEADNQLMSDLALTTLMRGETVEVKDEENAYDPVFSVRFKKSGHA